MFVFQKPHEEDEEKMYVKISEFPKLCKYGKNCGDVF